MHHPSELCNTLDNPDADSWLVSEENTANQKEKTIGSKEEEACRKACPLECERMTYESTRQEELDAEGYTVVVEVNLPKLKNLSMAQLIVHLENVALYQGGVVTMTEVSTLSFTTLVSNVGGTLGSFVGATTLTICQIVLFLVKYGLEHRRRNQNMTTRVMWTVETKK